MSNPETPDDPVTSIAKRLWKEPPDKPRPPPKPRKTFAGLRPGDRLTPNLHPAALFEVTACYTEGAVTKRVDENLPNNKTPTLVGADWRNHYTKVRRPRRKTPKAGST